MTKAIIIIDLPKGTKVEDFRIDEVRLYHTSIQVGYPLFQDEPLLKPMPTLDFETIAECSQTKEEYEAYINGWLDCFEEITGEEV